MTMTNTKNVEFLLEESQEDTAYISSINDLLESRTDEYSAVISGGARSALKGHALAVQNQQYASSSVEVNALAQGQQYASTSTDGSTFVSPISDRGNSIAFGYGIAQGVAKD